MKPYRSHGSGEFTPDQFKSCGEGVILERGVMVWHPETISIAANVYVGHGTMLKGYHRNEMVIGTGSWIGQMCFFHSAGGITIGKNVGIGPGVKILTSSHGEEGIEVPILHSRVDFAQVTIGDDCDLGVGSILLPGVTLGRGVQVGAGAVVTGNLPDFAVAAGVPARILRIRSEVKTPG